MRDYTVKDVARAVRFACVVHAGQVDKGGEPYAEHPTRVALRLVRWPLAAVAGALHDVVEDTGVTVAEVEADFGPEVAAAVDALTRRKSELGPWPHRESDYEYMARVLVNPVARAVKRADAEDNLDESRLSALPPRMAGRLRAKYTRMLAFLDGEEEAL